MKYKSTKIICAFVAILMVLSVFLTGCAKDDSNVESTTEKEGITNSTESEKDSETPTEKETETETKPQEPIVEIKNIFNAKDTFKGFMVYTVQNPKGSKRPYRYSFTTDLIDVKAGEKIYFGPCDPNMHNATDSNPDVKGHLQCYDSEGKAIAKNLRGSSFEVCDTFPNRYVIYSYTVPTNGVQIRITGRTCYDNVFVISKEQFKVRDFEHYVGTENMQDLNVQLNSKGVLTYRSDSFKGKTTLFIGDSICAANSENRRGWSGRIADATGMKCINNAEGGISMSTVREAEYGRIIDRYNQKIRKNEQYDFVILHGGVNDIWGGAKPGVVSDSFDVKSFDTSTFAGGLEELFYRVTSTQKDAKIGYIINFQTPKHYALGPVKNKEEYIEVSKKICEKWNIPYLNMYDDEEFNKLLHVTSDEFLFDKLHPSNYGYDILYKYIMFWMDKLPSYNDIKANPSGFNLQAFPMKEEYNPVMK